MLTSVISIIDIFSQVQTISNNCKYLSPEQLDLQNKNRTSILPWRGQFSPELIELFLKVYAHPHNVILDPFAGSGTTLFESARQGLSCYGTEINPAAVEMAKTAHFVNIEPAKRQKLINLAEEIIDKHLLPFAGDLFFYGFSEKQTSLDKQEIEKNFIIKIIQECDNQQILQNLLINAIINYHQQNQPRELITFRKALQKHINIIKYLPYSPHLCQVIHQDARNIPFSTAPTDIDEVILLRKAKRINSNIRTHFATYKGRLDYRDYYIQYLENNSFRIEVFEHFINNIRNLLNNEGLDESNVLEVGYF